MNNNQNKDNSVPNYIQPRKQPGIYMIHCLKNDWRYYGETSNISGRLASHRYMLKLGTHTNKVLQADWDQYGSSEFQFIPLFQGDAWSDPISRREKEYTLILQDRTISYNIAEGTKKPGEKNSFWGHFHTAETKKRIGDAMRGVPKELLGKKIVINSIQYASIAEASRITGHSRKLIRQRLPDPSWPDWCFLDELNNLKDNSLD